VPELIRGPRHCNRASHVRREYHVSKIDTADFATGMANCRRPI
jgi:hypothetical protein